MNLIHIVDKLNDKEYIYSNGLEISLQQAANSLVNKLTDTKSNVVEYNIHEDKCEIFTNEQVIERGWVWNSKNTTKKILYKLSYLPIYFKPKQIEQSVQTDEIKDKCTPAKTLMCSMCSINKNMDINFDNFFDVGDGASARQGEGDQLQIDFGLGYANNTFDPVKFNPFAQKTNIWSAPSNKYTIDYTLLMTNPCEPISSARSTNKVPGFDDLNTEIKKQLTLPNFGLRHFKQE
jgi:hypothetical protein